MGGLWHFVRSVWQTIAPKRRPCKGLKIEPLEERQVLSVTYLGGPLLHNVQVQSVYYGQPWASDSTLQQTVTQTDGFLQYLVASPYMSELKQYNVSTGSVLPHDLVGQNPVGQTISDTQIHQVLNAEIAAGRVSAPGPNSLYVFYTAPGVVVTANGQNSVNDFAAYHDTFKDTAGATVYYAVIPYPLNNIAAVSLPDFQQATIALSHEVAETVTDPDTQTGWLDPQGNEIADLDNGQFGTLNGYAVAGLWSQADGKAVIPTDTTGANLAVTNTQFQATTGQSFTGIVTTVSASAGTTAANLSTTIDWGDGTTSTGTVVADPNGGFDVLGTHSYTSSGFSGSGHGRGRHGTPPPQSVEVDVIVQNTASGSTALAVSNAIVSATPPTLVASGQNVKATVGTAFSGTVATFTDSDGNPASNFTATISWGDGSTSAGTIGANATGGFAVAGTHTYASNGSDALAVFLHDADGASATTLGMTTVAASSPFASVALGFTQSAEYDSNLVVKDYQQYLARTPNNSEIAYWVNVMQHGTTDAQVVAGFLASPEFFTRAGNSNKAWVDALYLDLLGRNADVGGEGYWLQKLAGSVSKADVAIGFVNSQERESGIIQGYYQQYLGRSGNAGELAYWVSTMQQGSADTQVLAAILGSREAFLHAGGTDKSWLDSLYTRLLNRPADAGGENFWMQVLAAAGA